MGYECLFGKEIKIGCRIQIPLMKKNDKKTKQQKKTTHNSSNNTEEVGDAFYYLVFNYGVFCIIYCFSPFNILQMLKN